MLTICSSKENIEAVWVKNEWSRFLGFRQNDNSKTLLPLYFGMDKAELPEEFALLSAYDIHTDGFEDELLRGIKKLIPLPIMKAKRRKQILKVTGIVAACLALIAGIAAAIIIPQKLEEKRLAEEEAIRASEAAALEKANEDAYQVAMTLFDNADYTAAEAAFIALGDYKDSAHMAARCPIQPDYDAAMQLYYDGKYAQATWALEALGDYEDAAVQKEKAELSWRKSLANISAADKYWNPLKSYTITPNGAVSDGLSEVIKVGQHGKVVSVETALVALYEDGTICSDRNGNIVDYTDYKDVVQIMPTHWDLGTIALKSDGTVVIVETQESFDERTKAFAAECFAETAEWKNIVKLVSCVDTWGSADFRIAVAGIDVEGNVFLCGQMDWFSPEVNGYEVKTFADHSQLVTNINSLSISVESVYGEGFFKTYYINAAALTNDGKIVTYINGETSTVDASDVVEVSLEYGEVYTLSSDGKYRQLGSNKVLQNDVIRLFNGGIITRSSTVVYDEWLAKMR